MPDELHAPLRGGPTAAPPAESARLRRCFWIGVGLRLCVAWFLAPANNDPHLEFVQFVAQERRLPFADELTLGFQPPLYYLLAAPLWWLSGSAKVVQLLSLALALWNLRMIFGFLERSRLVAGARGRRHAAWLAALLPQFVLFGQFVSNDALAFPLGTWLFLCLVRYVEEPTRRNLLLAALVQGLGLLTKGTFIAYLPVAAAAIAAVTWRGKLGAARAAGALLQLGLVAALVGGYKFAENAYRFGTPVVSNDELQQAWLVHQQGTWQGFGSLVDVDVTKLAREPFIAESNRHSIPLLLYGTFWAALIRESNFTHTREVADALVPRATYVLALVPTALMLLGAAGSLARLCRLQWIRRAPDAVFQRRSAEALALLALAGQVALVLAWGFKHDAWSFFQARLAFAAFLSCALLLGLGLDALTRRPALSRAAELACYGLYAAFAAYYAVEFTGELLEP